MRKIISILILTVGILIAASCSGDTPVTPNPDAQVGPVRDGYSDTLCVRSYTDKGCFICHEVR